MLVILVPGRLFVKLIVKALLYQQVMAQILRPRYLFIFCENFV